MGPELPLIRMISAKVRLCPWFWHSDFEVPGKVHYGGPIIHVKRSRIACIIIVFEIALSLLFTWGRSPTGGGGGCWVGENLYTWVSSRAHVCPVKFKNLTHFRDFYFFKFQMPMHVWFGYAKTKNKEEAGPSSFWNQSAKWCLVSDTYTFGPTFCFHNKNFIMKRDTLSFHYTGGTKCSQKFSKGLKTRFVSFLDIFENLIFFRQKKTKNILWRKLAKRSKELVNFYDFFCSLKKEL